MKTALDKEMLFEATRQAGERLRLFADDPAITQFFSARESSLIEQMTLTVADPARLQVLVLELKVLRDLHQHITGAIARGERAEIALAKMEQEKQNA